MQTLFRRSAVLLTITSALLLAGCAPSIEGKWKGDMTGGKAPGGAGNATLEFKKDGTLTQTMNAPMFGQVTATGTYKTEGDKVDISVKDIQAGGKSLLSMIPAQAMDRVKSQMNQKATFKVNGEKLELTKDGSTVTLDKVKE